MTRRHLLALAGATSLFGAKTTNAIGRSRLSAISDEVAHTPMDAIAFAHDYDLRWLELREVPGAKTSYQALETPELQQAAREFRDAGIKISFLNTGMLKYGLPGTEPRRQETPAQRQTRQARDQARFDARREELRKSINAAQILGVKDVRVFTFTRIEQPATVYARVADIIGEMAHFAEKEGVRLLVENETSCNVSGCAESAAFLKLLPMASVGLNWDVLNGVAYEKPYPDGYHLLPPERIYNVQAKGKTLLEYPEHLDWRPILAALARDGYAGQIGLETHIFGEGQLAASRASMRELVRLVETA